MSLIARNGPRYRLTVFTDGALSGMETGKYGKDGECNLEKSPAFLLALCMCVCVCVREISCVLAQDIWQFLNLIR